MTSSRASTRARVTSDQTISVFLNFRFRLSSKRALTMEMEVKPKMDRRQRSASRPDASCSLTNSLQTQQQLEYSPAWLSHRLLLVNLKHNLQRMHLPKQKLTQRAARFWKIFLKSNPLVLSALKECVVEERKSLRNKASSAPLEIVN